MDFIHANWGYIAAILFAISEILASTPIGANSVFQLIRNALKGAVKPAASVAGKDQ